MIYTVSYSQQAKNSLINIYRYIAIEQQAPENADSFLNYLQETVFNSLSHTPKMGRLWRDNTRFLVVKRYVVLYEVFSDEVLIIDIIVPGTNWR